MKILLITSSDITAKSGGGFASRAFFDSLNMHYPGSIDVIQYHALGGKIKSFLRGKIHRLYDWLLDYLDERKGEYQICVINSGLYGDLVPEIKKRGIRVVTIHHNYEAVFQLDNRRPTTLWGLTSWLVRRNERKAYQQSDLNIFLSAYDRDMMRTHYGTFNPQNDVVVGAYETLEQSKVFSKEMARKTHSVDVAVSGCLNHLQTELGIRDFEQHYDDLFRKMMPSSRLVITGRAPSQYIKRFANSGKIILEPNPDIISEVIKSCSIYLCPVNVGSGVKFRILDGLRLGMPVLSHIVSARGYEAFAEKPWFQSYHDTASFEKGLKSIIEYIEKHDNFRNEIIHEYQLAFSFEAGDRRFMEAFSNLDQHIRAFHEEMIE